MAFDDPCPSCGRRRRRYLMSTDSDAPGLGGLLRGEGDDRLTQRVAWLFVLFVVFGVAVGAFALAAALH